MITSLDNPKTKKARSILSDKKFRANEFAVSGKRWIADAARKGAKIKKVFFSSDKVDSLKEVLLLTKKIVGEENLLMVEKKVFAKLDTVEASQGILAIIEKSEKNLLPLGNKVLYLDGVKDPGNLGTIIRSAVAAGFLDIILSDCVDAYNPKALRASMSAILDARLIAASLVDLKKLGYRVYGTASSGKDFREVRKADKAILVMGSEAFGLSEEVKVNLDELLSVPMQQGVESLNVAIATAILMYGFYER